MFDNGHEPRQALHTAQLLGKTRGRRSAANVKDQLPKTAQQNPLPDEITHGTLPQPTCVRKPPRPPCRATLIGALHAPAVVIPCERADRPDQVRDTHWASSAAVCLSPLRFPASQQLAARRRASCIRIHIRKLRSLGRLELISKPQTRLSSRRAHYWPKDTRCSPARPSRCRTLQIYIERWHPDTRSDQPMRVADCPLATLRRARPQR